MVGGSLLSRGYFMSVVDFIAQGNFISVDFMSQGYVTSMDFTSVGFLIPEDGLYLLLSVAAKIEPRFVPMNRVKASFELLAVATHLPEHDFHPVLLVVKGRASSFAPLSPRRSHDLSFSPLWKSFELPAWRERWAG